MVRIGLWVCSRERAADQFCVKISTILNLEKTNQVIFRACVHMVPFSWQKSGRSALGNAQCL